MSTELPHLDSTVAAENARLRARIESLETEVSDLRSRESGGPRSASDRLARDVPGDIADEASRVFRALAHAFVEELRATADVVGAVADEAFRRRKDRTASRREEPAESGAGRAEDRKGRSTRGERIADDVASVVNTAIDRALDVPGRVIDRLADSYRESR